MRTVLLLAVLLGAVPAGADTRVYVCHGADGHKSVRDTPCEAGEQQKKAVDVQTHSAPIGPSVGQTVALLLNGEQQRVVSALVG